MGSAIANKISGVVGMLSELQRIELIDNYAAVFSNVPISESNRRIAEAVFRATLRDVSVAVRQNLSDAIKNHPGVPRDIAVALATDVVEVAVPMVQYSSVLTDDDLLKIVNTKSAEKQVAVASRKAVSARVSDSLVGTQNENVVSVLSGNRGATILEPTYGRVIDMFSGSDAILENLARRPELPLSVVRRLITIVSDDLRSRLENNYPLSEEAIESLTKIAEDKSTLEFLQQTGDAAEVESAVQDLIATGRLSQNMVAMGLCMGDLRFFEMATAELTRVPADNILPLLYDAGPLGLETIKKRIGLSDGLFVVLRMAMDLVMEIDYRGGGSKEMIRFHNEIVNRLDARFDGAASANLGYLFSRLERGLL